MKEVLHSIRFRFTMVVVGVLVFVIGALLFVNSNYLETYTIKTKLRTIGHAMELIEEYRASEYSDEALVALEKEVRSSNLDVVVMDNFNTLPRIVYASDLDNGRKTSRMIRYFSRQDPEETEIYEAGESYVIYKSYDRRLNAYQIDCLGLLGDDVGFALTTPLESIQQTVELSARFLFIIGLTAILVGALLMYMVTATLTRPIKRLSLLSQDMAELNFEARYEGGHKDEIYVLGQSMNQMSDRLKATIENLKETNLKLEAANAQLEDDLKEKERIDEMRREFLANVSHELKTPIALIQGYSEGLKDGISDDPDSMEFYCDVIIDEAQKMNTIVKRLLNLDEIENGSIRMTKERFDLAELIRGVTRSSEKLLPEGYTCDIQLELDPIVEIYADEFMMEQVVQNYMSNAFHYVSDGGVVRVSARKEEHSTKVYIYNTGSSIPDQDIEHLWDKFYKVDKARTRSYGGSGIGLSIVKAIITQHGGTYGVRNVDGGVEFMFSIPDESEE